ncbi:hypothetical protein Naga_100142g7 [Nannochloropsis gaditana]|uniref:Uncharacterized protein n=1 Tax=Nannochloropsis gaditana TaxID=72520 RepID=W7U816_9STRA|nr:hypothetical protein Naga_100142g7 [Nannochloropsis gaditana]
MSQRSPPSPRRTKTCELRMARAKPTNNPASEATDTPGTLYRSVISTCSVLENAESHAASKSNRISVWHAPTSRCSSVSTSASPRSMSSIINATDPLADALSACHSPVSLQAQEQSSLFAGSGFKGKNYGAGDLCEDRNAREDERFLQSQLYLSGASPRTSCPSFSSPTSFDVTSGSATPRPARSRDRLDAAIYESRSMAALLTDGASTGRRMSDMDVESVEEGLNELRTSKRAGIKGDRTATTVLDCRAQVRIIGNGLRREVDQKGAGTTKLDNKAHGDRRRTGGENRRRKCSTTRSDTANVAAVQARHLQADVMATRILCEKAKLTTAKLDSKSANIQAQLEILKRQRSYLHKALHALLFADESEETERRNGRSLVKEVQAVRNMKIEDFETIRAKERVEEERARRRKNECMQRSMLVSLVKSTCTTASRPSSPPSSTSFPVSLPPFSNAIAS